MGAPQDILKQTEMQEPRTPRALREWVDSKASELAQSREGRIYARSGARLPKKLMEEIRPFALFAYLRFRAEEVTCFPNFGNENFDGKIQFSDPSLLPVYVEITYAKDGYDERRRLSVLTNRGSVSAVGAITSIGTKAAGNQRIEVASEAVDHKVVVGTTLSIVKDRLTGKSGRKYGPQHVLVVVVEDSIAFKDDEDKIVLRQYAEESIASLTLDFGAIYLLGASGEYLDLTHGDI